ncbi:hypothetical protein BN1002_01305 [Bacillus sp. B-jedd]|nr:hypothetical protein BN1002_01305 [Bacillus sp. B-jedd]
MMYDHIYVLEKIMQFQEKEFRSLYVSSMTDRVIIKNLFFCKIPVVKQLSVCDCS